MPKYIVHSVSCRVLGVWALVFIGPFDCWARCGSGSGESQGDSQRSLGLVNHQLGLEGFESAETQWILERVSNS